MAVVFKDRFRYTMYVYCTMYPRKSSKRKKNVETLIVIDGVEAFKNVRHQNILQTPRTWHTYMLSHNIVLQKICATTCHEKEIVYNLYDTYFIARNS